MLRKLAFHSPVFIAVAISAGCAATPTVPSGEVTQAIAVGPTSIRNCTEIAADVATSERARKAAVTKEQEAWKGVVPLVVLARYASARTAAGDANLQLAELDAEAARLGCSRNVD